MTTVLSMSTFAASIRQFTDQVVQNDPADRATVEAGEMIQVRAVSSITGEELAVVQPRSQQQVFELRQAISQALSEDDQMIQLFFAGEVPADQATLAAAGFSDGAVVDVVRIHDALHDSGCLAIMLGKDDNPAVEEHLARSSRGESYFRRRQTVDFARKASAQREFTLREVCYDGVPAMTLHSEELGQLDSRWYDSALDYESRRVSVSFAEAASAAREERLNSLVVHGEGVCMGSRPKVPGDPAPDAGWKPRNQAFTPLPWYLLAPESLADRRRISS